MMPMNEDGRDGSLSSVQCQTEWSWLSAIRERTASDKTRKVSSHSATPRLHSEDSHQSRAENVSSINELQDPLTNGVESGDDQDDIPAEPVSVESVRPFPCRDDEYGIPLDKTEHRSTSESWASKEDEETIVDFSSASETGSSSSDELEESTDQGGEDSDDSHISQSVVKMIPEGVFEGLCQFCGQEKKSVYSGEEKDHRATKEIQEQLYPVDLPEQRAPAELYCCNEFKKYVDNVLDEKRRLPMRERGHGRGKSEKQTGGKRRLREGGNGNLKDETVRREEEEEEEEEEEAAGAVLDGESKGRNVGRRRRRKKEDGDPSRTHRRSRHRVSHVDIPREMTTINYQLSSIQCLEDGWTVRAGNFELPPEENDEDQPAMSTRSTTQSNTAEGTDQLQKLPRFDGAGQLVVKTYANGKTFLIVFPDGSGNIFYPSGNVAVTVLSEDTSSRTGCGGGYSYVVHADTPPSVLSLGGGSSQRLLAIFDTSASTAAVYYPNGFVRICLTSFGGLELDEKGTKKRKWTWNNNCNPTSSDPRQCNHPSLPVCNHSPPLYPIKCKLSAALSLHISSREDISLTFSCKGRGCQFNVGAATSRIETSGASELPGKDLFDINESYKMERYTKIQEILRKVSTLIRHPHSSTRRQSTVISGSLRGTGSRPGTTQSGATTSGVLTPNMIRQSTTFKPRLSVNQKHTSLSTPLPSLVSQAQTRSSTSLVQAQARSSTSLVQNVLRLDDTSPQSAEEQVVAASERSADRNSVIRLLTDEEKSILTLATVSTTTVTTTATTATTRKTSEERRESAKRISVSEKVGSRKISTEIKAVH